MLPRFEYGDDVRVIRNVRNDGTFPGKEVGELLVRRGSVGHVHDVGTYLQDQLIYRVYFMESGRMIGCREEELVAASEPWVDSLFEFRDRVSVKIPLSVNGNCVVAAGDIGTVMKILRDVPGGVQYHVHFPSGRMFQIPERALDLDPATIPNDTGAMADERGAAVVNGDAG